MNNIIKNITKKIKTIKTINIVILSLVSAYSQCSCGILNSQSDDKGSNAIIALLGIAGSNCARYGDTPVTNALFTGGIRTLYQTSSCDASGWAALGFDSNGTNMISTSSAAVTALPFSSYGTNVEVTFTAVSASGTLDIMVYGTGTAASGIAASSPAVRIVAGAVCSLQYRKSTDSLLYNVSTCTDSTTLAVGQSYTYCLDFNRGTGSSGSYTFGNMLAAWSRPCSQVASADRDQMGDVKLMQMMTIPTMNPSTSSIVGFSVNGMTIQSFRIGNTVYSSAM